MFLGAISLISEKLENNNKDFFNKFIVAREKLEKLLIDHKDLIAAILQKHISHKRIQIHHKMLDLIIDKIHKEEVITESDLITFAELEGKLITGDFIPSSANITDENKSKAFIHTALRNAIKCPICNGYLDVEKSVSYDHIKRVREGGSGSADNCQLTHPYCNQSVKQ